MRLEITALWLCLGILLALPGCRVEKNFRGVPEPQWSHLTAEQKQMIVDQSFHSEMKMIGSPCEESQKR